MTGTPSEAPFAQSVEETLDRFEVDPDRGLDEAATRERRERYGPNRLREHETRSALSILLHQFASVIVWLLAAAAAFSLFLGDIPEAVAIGVVLLINSAIGFFTELRAARSMEALQRIAEIRTRVRREGSLREIDARELVPGDIVAIEAGDVVTADLRLIESAGLQADESALTGESAPVSKSTEALDPDAVLGDRLCMLHKGTAVTQGSGAGVVVATGMDTELGRISDLAQKAESEVSPLDKRLDRLGRRLVWLTLGLAALATGAGLLRGHPLTEMIQTGVALAVAAVPEGLPVVATLSLARGMWRMAERNAVITRLSSVETLGATTLILTDKTGTLTENRMTARRYLLAEGDVEVDPDADERRFVEGEEAVDPSADADLSQALRLALEIGALCANAELGEGEDGARSGDPMELALLDIAARAGLARRDLLDAHAEIREHAFDPDLKMMATVHDWAGEGDGDGDGDEAEAGDGRYLYAVKGAPEAVIEACARELTADGPRDLDDSLREDWTERAREAAADGLRLLALAMKRADSDESEPYEGLMLVGLVCLLDPLRDAVPDAIADAQRAGVRVVMITGDHAETAARIAADAGLDSNQIEAVEGREIADLDFDSLAGEKRERILDAAVFARVAPATKLDIVALHQDAGEIVAMTGDGVNDAPALRKADIGVAMGQRGTQVAREAADMVLKDDAFETIVAAMRQGRVIFDNIRKFVVYLMSCNVSEVLVIGLAVGVGLPTPLLPLQILFLNLVTDVFPAFALGLGKGDADVMRRPPRDPDEPIVTRTLWGAIGLLGGVITLAVLAAFALALFWLDLGDAAAITVAFLTLALAQLWNVFNIRPPGSGLLRNDVVSSLWVWAALALCVGLIALALLLPGLSDLLRLPWPGASGLWLALGLSFAPLVIGQVALALAGRSERRA